MYSTESYDNGTSTDGYGNDTVGPDDSHPELFQAAKGLISFRKFGICPVGILANVLCVIVLLRGDLRKMMLLPYLVALAIVDGLYLCTDLLNEVVGQLTLVTSGYCKFSMYIALTCGAYSDLIIVAMAVHRLIAVCLPLKAHRIVTMKTTLGVSVILLVIVCAMYSVSLLSYGLYGGHEWCLPVPEYEHLTEYEVMLGLVKTVFCSVAILVVTIAIVIKLRLNKRNFTSVRSSTNTETHVTVMLLCTTTLFLVTNLPLSIYVFFQTFMKIQRDLDFLIYALVLTLKAMGLTCDFFLYFVASSIFRTEVKRRICFFVIKEKLQSLTSLRTHRNSNTQDPILQDTIRSTTGALESSYL